MSELLGVVGAAVGGMVGMAGALGYTGKKLVDLLGDQLKAQNNVIGTLETTIKGDLKQHISDCKVCQNRR